MRRLLVAVLASLVVVLVVVVGAFALTVANPRDDFRYGMGGMMSGPGPSETRRGPGGGMHGPAAANEFEFLAEMVAHHEEAVSSGAELQRSGRAELRSFGQSIIKTQSAQIKQMRAWLEQWYPDRPTDVDYQPMMRDLSGLDGDALDRAFLEDMIGHHMAAVMMSQHLVMSGVADHDEVNQLAVTIRDEQHREIFQMRRWLAEWFGAGGGWHMGGMMG